MAPFATSAPVPAAAPLSRKSPRGELLTTHPPQAREGTSIRIRIRGEAAHAARRLRHAIGEAHPKGLRRAAPQLPQSDRRERAKRRRAPRINSHNPTTASV